MRTVEIQVFEFDELDKKVREKVINKMSDNESFEYLEDMIKDWIKEELKINKIEMIKDTLRVYYDLSDSQGSGLCFEGRFMWEGYTVIIAHVNNHYYHKNTVEVKIQDENGDTVEDERTETEFNNIYDNICDKVEKIGREEIEYQCSEEAIREQIKESELEFYADGRIYEGYKV